MRIFVINRAQDVVRWQNAARQLDERGITYERVEAVDGRALSDAEKANLADFKKMKRVLRILSDGEIGCAASHLKIYRKVVLENIDGVIVFEDDVKFLVSGSEFESWVKKLEEAFECNNSKARVVLFTDRKFGMVWTIGYYINLKAARVILKYNQPIWRVADCWESLVRRRKLGLDWSSVPLCEPNSELGSVITPNGIPPHRVGLAQDVKSRIKRAFWRCWYGIGLKI